MTYDQFGERAVQAKNCRRDWGLGQAMFNTLADTHLSVANQIQGTLLDPWHAQSFDDPTMVRFLGFIQRYFPTEA